VAKYSSDCIRRQSYAKHDYCSRKHRTQYVVCPKASCFRTGVCTKNLDFTWGSPPAKEALVLFNLVFYFQQPRLNRRTHVLAKKPPVPRVVCTASTENHPKGSGSTPQRLGPTTTNNSKSLPAPAPRSR